MSLIKSEPGANPAEPTSDRASATGAAGLAMTPAVTGFTEVPFPAQRPATSNTEVQITANSIGADQQGTSIGAYKDQSPKPSAESGG